jgi:hypothetical protein
VLSTVSVASVFSEDTVSEVFAVSVAAVLLLPQPANADTAKTPAKIVVSTLFFII